MVLRQVTKPAAFVAEVNGSGGIESIDEKPGKVLIVVHEEGDNFADLIVVDGNGTEVTVHLDREQLQEHVVDAAACMHHMC